MQRRRIEHDFVFRVQWASFDIDRLLDDFPIGLRDLGKFWPWTGRELSKGHTKPALGLLYACLNLPRNDPRARAASSARMRWFALWGKGWLS
jgi:hypothetical protein